MKQLELGFYYFFKYEKESIEFRNFQSKFLQYNHFDDLIYYYFLERDLFVRFDYLMDQSLRENMKVNLEDFNKIIAKVVLQAQEIKQITDIQVNLDLTLIYIKIDNNQERLQQRYKKQQHSVLFLEYDHLLSDFKAQLELYYQQIQRRQNFYQNSQQTRVSFSDLFSCLGKRKKQVFEQGLLTDFLLNNFEDYYKYNIKYLPDQCNKIVRLLKNNKQTKNQDQLDILILNDIDRILTMPDKEIEIFISYLKWLSQFQKQINNFPVLKYQIYNYLQQMLKSLQINDKLVNLDQIYSRIMKDIILKTVNSDFNNKQTAGYYLSQHKDQIGNIVFTFIKNTIMNL